jgi:galactokinase
MKDELIKEFRNRFHKEPEHVFFCPGRINLIGEHIDYNGGKVMPCAISLGTYLAVSKNTDNTLRFEALDFPEKTELKLQPSYSKTGKEWYNYPLGVMHHLLQDGHTLSGMDMLFSGNLPVASGLSSSASIEVLTMFAMSEMFALNIDRKDIAIACKKVENEFIGVNSGIMDQFAVAMGKDEHAILLDCDTLAYEYIPMQLGNNVLAVINTNKPRKLAESKYNERFEECGKALAALKKELPIQNLCDATPEQFISHKHLINDPVLEKRALHVITENDRVRQATKALKRNDLVAFGKLMFASHQSLEDLYEVSGKELDTIVAFSRNYDGCIGARMTGAGFGGCAIALVKKKCMDEYATKIKAHYKERIGYDADVFASGAAGGVRKL